MDSKIATVNGRDFTWSNVIITTGKEVVNISPKNWESEIKDAFDRFSGVVNLTKKEFRRFKSAMKGLSAKKHRIPRKIKKKMKCYK